VFVLSVVIGRSVKVLRKGIRYNSRRNRRIIWGRGAIFALVRLLSGSVFLLFLLLLFAVVVFFLNNFLYFSGV